MKNKAGNMDKNNITTLNSYHGKEMLKTLYSDKLIIWLVGTVRFH